MASNNPVHADIRARLRKLGWASDGGGDYEDREWWWDHRTNSYLCVALPTDTTKDKRILVCWWPTTNDDYDPTTMPQVRCHTADEAIAAIVALRLGAGRM